jgi:adenylate cyclase
MRVTHDLRGRRQVTEIASEDVVLGRRSDEFTPDLDLGEDAAISRKHARLWLRDGHYWVQDLGSTSGTFVNDIPLDYRRQLKPGDVVRVGETLIQVEPGGKAAPALSSDAEETPTVLARDEEPPTVMDTQEPSVFPPDPDVDIATVLDAGEAFTVAREDVGTELQSRLSLLIELPLQFAAQTELEPLLQLIVEQLVRLVPGAQRGALLLHDAQGGRLRLKAHHPPGDAAVSETLARRALADRQGFIWNRNDSDSDASDSIRRLGIDSGMYAPLLWNGEPLGVLCVDNSGADAPFEEADLRFVLSIAHYAAAAVANRRLQEQLQAKSTVLERLLTQFSPKLRALLLDKALAGKLRPGGEKSEVTILLSDIRGFTNTAARMDPHDVVDMLNDYFPPLVQAIFQHDGTIDKFVGDAILAVFGSPEPDPHQHEKAVFAALAMQEAMKLVNARRKERGDVACEIGIGVHCGEVLHGFIGAAERLEFTVIGDPVNKTARYCDGAQPGEVLISPAVFEHAYRSVTADNTTIPTKHEGELPAYRVRGRK